MVLKNLKTQNRATCNKQQSNHAILVMLFLNTLKITNKYDIINKFYKKFSAK
jgi:hypothetical protein